LQIARNQLSAILQQDLPQILNLSGKNNRTVCVIPRAKAENTYRQNQHYLKLTIRNVINSLGGFVDGTDYIIRHTNTRTTHKDRSGYGGDGELPYPGITKDTCQISGEVIGKDILLIDDLYTKSVNIDEDCIQALLNSGANSVIFYAVGKTVFRKCITL
jgi:predicted amidophosphoribosyltransferase